MSQNPMKAVQQQKLSETIQLMRKLNCDKQEFFKQYIPVQEILIQRISCTATLSKNSIAKLVNILKEQKQAHAVYLDHLNRMFVKKEEFKIMDQKKTHQQFGEQDWNRNVLRVLGAMSEAHAFRLAQVRNYEKIVETSLRQVSKLETTYQNDMKSSMKELSVHFDKIDSTQKQMSKVLAKLEKQMHSKEMKDSVYFLSETHKVQELLQSEIDAYVARNKALLSFMKQVIKWEKGLCHTVKQVLTTLMAKKKQLFRSSQESENLSGLVSVLEDNVQESRQLYLQKTLLTPELQESISRLLPPEKSKVHHLIKVLSMEGQELRQKMGVEGYLKLTSNICYKYFNNVSLAQGWIITSYTPAIVYLTFDHLLAIYDKDGNLLKKILANTTTISKVTEDNIIFLQQTTKGFFSNNKQEYQLKFAETDRMEEFILFMENEIQLTTALKQ